MADDTRFGLPETTVAYDDFQLDPGLHDGDRKKPGEIWTESQKLRVIVEGADPKPGPEVRKRLREALFGNLRTLQLYRIVGQFIAVGRPGAKPAPENELTLYVIFFPGEGRDNTGIKDLNDKVLGYGRANAFIRERNKAIVETFTITGPGPGYITLGQDYKTTSVLARGKTPKDVAKDLAVLDAKLVTALVGFLDQAIADSGHPPKMKEECRKVRRAVTARNYRFDFLYGSSSRLVQGDQLDNTFLLTTEALKGAGIARFGVKAKGLRSDRAKGRALGRVPSTPKGHDDRGQPFDLKAFQRVAQAAPDVKAYVVAAGPNLSRVFVDTVWTDAYFLFEDLYWGNPDVIRDVRKRALRQPKMREGIKFDFASQRELLELWLVALNLIDFIGGFRLAEYGQELQQYHRVAAELADALDGDAVVKWGLLTPALSSDVRQQEPIAQLGSTSEYRFYARASDFSHRIFVSMDVRDLGVDLMFFYELANLKIVTRKLRAEALLAETIHAGETIVERRRFTYDKVVEVFRRRYFAMRGDPQISSAFGAAIGAFGASAGAGGTRMPPTFDQSAQFMLGGDEIFVAAHPLYTAHIGDILRELDGLAFENQPINLRAGVAFSTAPGAGSGRAGGPSIPPDQRERNQIAHEEALLLSSSAPNVLKQFERAHRRIERLIHKLEVSKNSKKNDLVPAFQKRLDDLGLLEIYARVKHGEAEPLPPARFDRLLRALRDEDVAEAERNGTELVDFRDRKIDRGRLESDAARVEKDLRQAVGFDNFHADLPPFEQAAAVAKWILDKTKEDVPELRGPKLPGDKGRLA